MMFASQGLSQNRLRDFNVGVTLESFAPVDKIFLEYSGNRKNSRVFHIDSITPVSGPVSFTGKIREPWKASLKVKYKPRYLSGFQRIEVYNFFLTPGKIQINARKSLRNIPITGPHPTIDYLKIREQELIYEAREDSLLDILVACEISKNQVCSTWIEEELQNLEKERLENIYIAFFIKNVNSPLALYAFYEGLPHKIDDADRFLDLIEMLPPHIRKIPWVKKLNSKIEASRNGTIGNKAIDFNMRDVGGKMVSLSSFRGKFLYLDFWASWCIPCRRQHPALVEIYKIYKDHNFEILGVALERKKDKDKWIKAIRTDNLSWYHISDLNYWDNKAADLYGIRAIPANFLLNPEGIIIAKNLEPAELSKKLSELIILEGKH